MIPTTLRKLYSLPSNLINRTVFYADMTAKAALNKHDPDIVRTFAEIVRAKNYPFEQHSVETKDGFLLTVHRIPGKQNQGLEEALKIAKPAILLQHGILDSSDTWIMNVAEKAPAFMLADQGYDIWMSNSRGNKYSRKHIVHDPKEHVKNFWDFSFETMGRYDLPAVIDYILHNTGQKKVAYIGHSQGTTQLFAALTKDLEYFKEKVSLFIAWAPVARLDYCKATVLSTLALSDTLIKMVKQMGIHEFFPSNEMQNQTFAYICKLFPILSQWVVQLISDLDPRVNNDKRVPVFLNHFPSGTSLKSLLHFGQLIKYKKFQAYDYGVEKENIEHYGTAEVPVYDLKSISGFHIALMGGEDDLLAAVKDVEWLRDELIASIVFYQQYKYGHMSFLMHKEMPHMKDTVDLLKIFHSQEEVKDKISS